MTKVCMGCGLNMQSENSHVSGFVPEEKMADAIYCERCFRLKHYHEMRESDLSCSNEELLKQALTYDYPIYYFVDLLNLNEESLSWFRKISGPKKLILTKVDLIPNTISLPKLKKQIQKIYDLSDFLFLSVKDVSSVRTVWNSLCKENSSKILFLGMTNVGKSSFLNCLSKLYEEEESPILVSEMPNTTLSFFPWNVGSMTLIDAPGFNYTNSFSRYDWHLKIVPKKYIKPITWPCKLETFICLEDLLAFSQNLEKNHVTFYGSNLLSFQRIYRKPSFAKQTQVVIPAHSDLVIPGLGFFYFTKETTLTLLWNFELSFEIRPSLFGVHYDTN